MKKILQFGLFTMLVSGFMSANAAKMDGAMTSSSLDQLTEEQLTQRTAKLRDSLPQLLPVLLAEYAALKHSIANPDKTTEAKYPALRGFLMELKDLPVWLIEVEINPVIDDLLQSRQGPYNKSFKALISAVKSLNNRIILESVLETYDGCAPYFDIISILESTGETLATMYASRINSVPGYGDFRLPYTMWRLLDEEYEKRYIMQMRVLEELDKAGLINEVWFHFDDDLSKVLSENLKLEGDREFIGIKFRGELCSWPATSKIPFQVVKDGRSVRHVELCRVILVGNELCKFITNHNVRVLRLRDVGIDGVRYSVSFRKLFSKTLIEEFGGSRNGKDALFWLMCLPKSVQVLGLGVQHSSFEEKFLILKTALERLPKIKKLQLTAEDTAPDLKTIIYALLTPSLEELIFCGHSLCLDSNKEDAMANSLKRALVDAKIDGNLDVIVKMLMEIRKCSLNLDNLHSLVDFLVEKLTSMNDFLKKLSPNEADLIAATEEFCKTAKEQRDDIETDFDLQVAFLRALLDFSRTLWQIDEAGLQEELGDDAEYLMYPGWVKE